VSRCKRLGRALDKLSSPNLEKALTFLDDKLLPATSNAVERSNRRYRKAQKSIYSVRTAEHIRQRIALDMQRDQQAPDRTQTTKALHQARSGTKKLQECYSLRKRVSWSCMATHHVHVYTTAVTRVLTSCFWRKNERRTMGAYVGQMSG